MHHDGDGGKGEKRFKLKVRHVILGVFAALLIVVVVHLALLSSGANRRLEALRAAGQPTSLAELALRNKLPMGMENAAPVYETAFTAFVPPADDPNVPYLGKVSESPDRKAVWPEPVARSAADCLAANERCLALLHEAAGIGTCRYDYDYGKEFPRFKELRACAQLLKLATVHHAQQGDADAAIARIKDGLCLGDSLRDEPQIISYLVHIACSAIAVTGLERTLSLAAVTDAQLKDLDGALAVTAERIDLAHAMTTERCYLIDMVRNPSLTGGPGPGAVILKFPGVQSQGLIDLLDHMQACIEAAGLPPVQRSKRFDEIQSRLDGLSILHISAKALASALTRVSVLDSRAHAHLDLARTALAIERHHLATGKPPEQLTDLVSMYLEQVPIDPFDGQPIRYRRTDPGYILYSIREDGQDNGGKEQHEVGKGEPYDLCFIVTR